MYSCRFYTYTRSITSFLKWYAITKSYADDYLWKTNSWHPISSRYGVAKTLDPQCTDALCCDLQKSLGNVINVANPIIQKTSKDTEFTVSSTIWGSVCSTLNWSSLLGLPYYAPFGGSFLFAWGSLREREMDENLREMADHRRNVATTPFDTPKWIPKKVKDHKPFPVSFLFTFWALPSLFGRIFPEWGHNSACSNRSQTAKPSSVKHMPMDSAGPGLKTYSSQQLQDLHKRHDLQIFQESGEAPNIFKVFTRACFPIIPLTCHS